MSEARAGHIVEHVTAFCRLLRAAGLPVGPAQTLDAIQALDIVGLARREDVYAALEAVLVTRAEERVLFDAAFRLFWRPPAAPEITVPADPGTGPQDADARGLRRLAEALALAGETKPPREIDMDARFAFSADEALRKKDFAQMSRDEEREAFAALARFRLDTPPVPTRRVERAARGPKLAARATLRRSLARGGEVLTLVRQKPRWRPADLVVLCDISGSMAAYSRTLLHFLHGLARGERHLEAFVFGTRLTSITRDLRHRDVDEALAGVTAAVPDWGGGTRIGAAIEAFNRDWSRRVLARGAVVLLITDGLDRAAGDGLGPAMERLHKSCRRLVWLNPLLRYEGFEPKSLGIRAMLPHVDEMRPVHNLDSVRALVDVLSDEPRRRRAA